MEDNKLKKEEILAIKEYEFCDTLRESYFKNSWVAMSIILPICFGLVGLSYSEWLIGAKWYVLLPLALASLFLNILVYWWTSRYGEYLKIIYRRMQELEAVLGMKIHTKIKTESRKGWYSLLWQKRMMLLFLILAWSARILVASFG